ncbi:MAG: hypothetical protein QOG69_368 [Actinomycetota bacterium]|jgi:hypothetical protein|nr:hypothetical protein [Actinomycetota bacterium]
MVAAVVVGIGPPVWAIVLDGRPRRLEREVLSDLDQLPVAVPASDGVRGDDRFSLLPAQRGDGQESDPCMGERGRGGGG